MALDVLTFGEILWDCLPSGRHAGGAPFNVAVHLAQLGLRVGLISAVGQDALGDELLAVARDKHVDPAFITRGALPTGTVQAKLDARNNATYDIVHPVAWDQIALSPNTTTTAAGSQALVFGSLAARSPHNVAHLEALLDLASPLKFFDVNLRPPFVDRGTILRLARRAGVLKLNDDELTLLSDGRPSLTQGCAALAAITGVRRICVTCGASGAAWWEDGTLTTVPAPPVTVRDTVGAGDAFMAGLVAGLIRGTAPQQTLEHACRLGAFVASHFGATPELPAELRAG